MESSVLTVDKYCPELSMLPSGPLTLFSSVSVEQTWRIMLHYSAVLRAFHFSLILSCLLLSFLFFL